ncbi:hypothetical protein N665_2421s0006 [Sinapis alba]|nr:hypothetical protein N665_2421s0006 [Sinapis alba]
MMLKENQQQSKDQQVDIFECENPNDEFQEEEEILCQSSSSSFGDSLCARDDDDCGFEAQSMLNKDYPLPETCSDGTELLGLKKKKLTDEWRRFSQPLMWRCKWLELKVKEIESQARVYDKEVQSYYQSQQFDLEKSKPYYGDQTQRMDVFKRGKRRRVEETTDVSAYISNHNVFSYTEKRKPTTLKAQCPVPGRKATGKEDESEDDCFVSESHCSDDLIGEMLCKIDEAQDKAKRLKKRVDELMMCKSHNTSSMPRTIARSRSDFTAEIGKQDTLVEAHNQREGTVQIGRQRISADHNEDVLLISQAPPPFEVDGQFLFNNSPNPYGGLRFSTIDDLLMDGDEYEEETDKEELDNCFMKLMNEFGGETMSEEEDDDVIPPH